VHDLTNNTQGAQFFLPKRCHSQLVFHKVGVNNLRLLGTKLALKFSKKPLILSQKSVFLQPLLNLKIILK
jgi:hypothetical protein